MSESERKHTKGPWVYQPADDYCGPYVTDETNSPSGTICDLYHFPPVVVHKPQEAEANGRLIASAPEMLEALEAWIVYHNGEDNHDAQALAYRKAFTLTRAAISKATGGAG